MLLNCLRLSLCVACCCTWLPPVINKQGAFKKERLENPDAALLAQRLSQFLGLTNHGFVGEKQRTAPLALHSPEKSQFERMFF